MSHVMLRGLTLSIVIPTPGDSGALEETLLSVLENRPEGCEVVVALGCEYDDPWNLAEEVRFVRAPEGSGLVGCVTAGVQATTGDVVHLLAAGWKATPGWADAALSRFEDATTGAVIPLGIDGAPEHRVVSAGVKYKRGGRRVALTRPGMGTTAAVGSGAERRVGARRPQWPVVGPRLEAGFWRADLVRDAGAGFSAACGDRLADVDMAVELATRGVSTVVEEGSRVVAGGEPAWERGFRSGLHGERLFWRSLAGRSFLPSFLLHVIEVIRHTVVSAPLGTVPMLLGRFVGACQLVSHARRRRQLAGYLATDLATDMGIDTTTEAAADAAADAAPADSEGTTIRIDEGQEILSGPRRRPRGAEPLRKSA